MLPQLEARSSRPTTERFGCTADEILASERGSESKGWKLTIYLIVFSFVVHEQVFIIYR